jgi:hypothetical protein
MKMIKIFLTVKIKKTHQQVNIKKINIQKISKKINNLISIINNKIKINHSIIKIITKIHLHNFLIDFKPFHNIHLNFS